LVRREGAGQYDEKSKSVGASVTIGAGAGGSFNYGKTDIHSNYQSVHSAAWKFGAQSLDQFFRWHHVSILARHVEQVHCV
jgi:hypothetical protein